MQSFYPNKFCILFFWYYTIVTVNIFKTTIAIDFLIGDLSSTKYLAISTIILSNKFKICTILTHEDLRLNFSG